MCVQVDSEVRNTANLVLAEILCYLFLTGIFPFRLWSRRAAKQRELHEQRQLAAEAALNTLPLGIPVRQNNDEKDSVSSVLVVVIRSRLNVSDVVSGILGQRNPDAKWLCWKIILCSPDTKQRDQQEQKNQDTKCGNLDEATSRASTILFIISCIIPLKFQKTQLQNVLNLVPHVSCLPLLVLSGSYYVEGSNPTLVIVNEFGLHDIDKSRVSAFLAVFLGAVKFLPSVQWSSALKTASLEHSLKECRLSCFPDDIFLLQSGPKMGKDIDNHRLLLENCLVEYLTQSTKTMGIQLS
ncbi:hypothetical protein V6N13_040619 [Hibiscus sabdariffa]|uniref:Uncharacterized protein n=1 Tax=Hibiscus sabdariffa TaxID=183260 RepID=A0ABR2R8W3_9ROSI